MTRQILCTILLFVGSAGFVAWRVCAVRNLETPQFEILKDPSASHGNACASLAGLAEKVLATNGATTRSTLTVLVLGDQSTANEPWRMGTYPVPTIRKVLEGRSARSRQEEGILRDISGKCEPLRQTTTSPIFLGVTRAVADLRTRGCKATSRCQLFVDSDLEENVERSIRKQLNTNDATNRISSPQIDNGGIEVTFCGIAVTDGRLHNMTEKGIRRFVMRDSDRARRLPEVWRSLFTEPGIVHFEPYCPSTGQSGPRPVPGTPSDKGGSP
jgi:hypothetical protein